MASVENQFLVPDEKILSEIFPGVVGLKLTGCNIISKKFIPALLVFSLKLCPLATTQRISFSDSRPREVI